MPDRRLVSFQDTLNRTLNKTVSRGRLTVFEDRDRTKAGVASFTGRSSDGTFQLGTVPLTNGYHLSVRMFVRLTGPGVTTLQTSIAYRATPRVDDDRWIFRYDYEAEQAQAPDYRYPVAHLHINAEPIDYRGAKRFRDLHLPTRRLSLEALIRHLVVEHNVPTFGDTAEALAFLEDQQEQFERRRTDPDKLLRSSES